MYVGGSLCVRMICTLYTMSGSWSLRYGHLDVMVHESYRCMVFMGCIYKGEV